MSRKKVSKIGGQAVLEGVMMKGEHSMATAVRDEFGDILIESERITPLKEKNKLFGLPIARGVVAFFDSLVKGTKILLKSAEVYGGDAGEPTRFEKWLSDKTKISVLDIAIFLGLVFGIGLSVGLFFVLPQVITEGIVRLFSLEAVKSIYKNLIAGAIKIMIFVGYILLVSLLKDIRRTFMYHGAEHKVINCFESGLDMNVANAQKMTTVNDRCGTTFIFIVMIVSIISFSFLGWGNLPLRIVLRLALLPLVAGVSYELLKLLSKSDNFIVKIFKAPGLLLQKITTKEPDDDMVEVALEAFNTVQRMESDKDYPVESFKIKRAYVIVRALIDEIIKDVKKEEAETDWILSTATGVNRSGLKLLKYVDKSAEEEAVRLAKERATGKPLQYAIGTVEFYRLTLKVDERALIPRPETEILVEKALEYAKGKALDIATGSGNIALAIKAHSGAEVTASDISPDAIELAKENAASNSLDVKFVVSDLFEAFSGEKFDLITVNPPYIETEHLNTLQDEVKCEPRIALDGGKDGLKLIKRIIDGVKEHLNKPGTVFMEVGFNQADIVVKLFEEKGFIAEKIKDLEGKDRIVKAEYVR
ncbi:MAG: peptide chain release factor N(5)-glutamine methyltransferase [Christensenellales bacterium]|jgi:release factor-specific protein-(glutamine-N5) methyltransferase